MSTFQYGQLNAKDRIIRLVQIELIGRKPQYSLIEAPINGTKFSALSYTWGDHKNRRNIQVNGQNLRVTANLDRALEDVATFWRKSNDSDQADLLLWVDQICINQRDDDEKSHQVSLMGDIYRTAQEVLVWLSLGRDVKFGFRDWSAWSEWHREQLTSPQSSELPPGRIAMSYNAISQPRQDYPVVSGGDAVVKNQLLAWENIHSIITSPWWERAWVYTEFMLAAKATFLFGGLWAPWESFEELLELYERQRETHVKFCTFTLNMLKHQEGQRPQVSKFCGCFGRKEKALPKDPNTAKEQRLYLRRHSQHIVNLAPYWTRINGYFNDKLERRAREDKDVLPLSALLKHARNCKVSDPRDRVYAVLSLASPAYSIRIDYSLSTNKVMTAAARAIIQQEQRLDIIAIAQENNSSMLNLRTDRMPSWVPNWSFKDDPESPYRQFLRQIQFPMARYSYGGGGAGTRASQSSSPVVFFFPNGILQAKALFVDRLHVMIADDESRNFRTFISDSGYKVSTVRKAEVGDEIWILLGADEVFTLRQEDDIYSVLGHAMVREYEGEMSDIMLGSMMDLLRKGAISASDIRIG